MQLVHIGWHYGIRVDMDRNKLHLKKKKKKKKTFRYNS